MLAFFRTVVVFFLCFGQFLLPIEQKIFAGGEDKFFENWSSEQEYTSDYAVTVEKKADKDFVVLNITDVQMRDIETNGEAGSIAKATIDKLVEETKPDLITLSGDNAWQTFAYIQLCNLLDSYNIPWAPVMGNHDGQGCVSEFWCAKLFDNAENCLFKFGPKGMGYGNYVINITENGKVVHTLFMMDTHSDIQEDGINGPKGSGYDHLWANQLEWYKWVVKGIAKQEGHTVESSAIMHIPVYEYRDAWDMVKMPIPDENPDDDFVPYIVNPQFSDIAYGENNEGVYSANVNNGFFTICQELGSTKNIIVGHDHSNDFSINYHGIRLTYAVKTGMGCYWTDYLNGGTTLTVNSNGVGKIQQHYVDYKAIPEAKIPMSK